MPERPPSPDSLPLLVGDEEFPRFMELATPPKAVLKSIPQAQSAQVELISIAIDTPQQQQNRISVALKDGWIKLTSAFPQASSPKRNLHGMLADIDSSSISIHPTPSKSCFRGNDLYTKQFAFQVSADRGKTFLANGSFPAQACLDDEIAKEGAGLEDYSFDKFKRSIIDSLADEKGITSAKLLGFSKMKLLDLDEDIDQIGWRAGGWNSKVSFEIIDSQIKFEDAIRCLEGAHKTSPVLEFEVYRPPLTRPEVRVIADGLQVYFPDLNESIRNNAVVNHQVGGDVQAAADMLALCFKVRWKFETEDMYFAHLSEIQKAAQVAIDTEKEARKEKKKALGKEKIRELCDRLCDRYELNVRPSLKAAKGLLVACDLDISAASALWEFQDPRWETLKAIYKTATDETLRHVLIMETGVVDLASDALDKLGYLGYYPEINRRGDYSPSEIRSGPAALGVITSTSPPNSPTSIPSEVESPSYTKQYYRSRKKKSITEIVTEKVAKPAGQIRSPIKKAVRAISTKPKDVVPQTVCNYDYRIVGENVYRIGFEGQENEAEIGADVDNNMVTEEIGFNIDAEDMTKGALRLQKLQESTAFHQMDAEGWLACCRLFQFDPAKQGYADLIPLAGLNRPLFQHQAFSVYWQMKQGRSSFGGGFVGDDPGLGKSLSFLAYIVAERQLAWLHDDVEKSRAIRDGRHLGQQICGPCPSNCERTNWISCPCSRDNETSAWSKKEGLRLVCVAAPLVPYWRSQWKAHVDSSEPRLRMQLLIAHKGTTKDKEAKGDEDALLPHNVNQLKSVQQEPRRENKARTNQDRFLVVTSPATFFDSWLPKFMYQGDVLVAGATGRGKWEKTQKKLGIVFGIAMIDEFHEDYRFTGPRPKVLAALPGRPFCWGYSGTPYGQSPRCLEGVLWAIESHAVKSPPYGAETGWEQTSKMMPYAHRQLDVICQRYESYVKAIDKNPKDLDEIIERFVPFVKAFVLRRTGETKWHDRRIMQLKPHYHTDVFLQNDYTNHTGMIEVGKTTTQLEASVLASLQAKAQAEGRSIPTKLSQASKWTQQYRFRVIAAFPYLASLFPKPLSLNPEEVDAMRKNEQNSLYAKELKHICNASPAWQWLKHFVIQHIADKVDINGHEQKLVILTAFPTTAFIIKLMLNNAFPTKKSRIGLIHGGMETPHRIDAVNAFIDELTPRGTRKSKENYQFLIGTTRMLGTGFTFVRACNLVLIGPDWQHVVEKQAYGRVNRIGQINARSFSYRLINVGAVVDRKIVARQLERREGRGTILGEEEKMTLRDCGAALAGVRSYEVDMSVLKIEGNDAVVTSRDKSDEERLADLVEMESFLASNSTEIVPRA